MVMEATCPWCGDAMHSDMELHVECRKCRVLRDDAMARLDTMPITQRKRQAHYADVAIPVLPGDEEADAIVSRLVGVREDKFKLALAEAQAVVAEIAAPNDERDVVCTWNGVPIVIDELAEHPTMVVAVGSLADMLDGTAAPDSDATIDWNVIEGEGVAGAIYPYEVPTCARCDGVGTIEALYDDPLRGSSTIARYTACPECQPPGPFVRARGSR